MAKEILQLVSDGVFGWSNHVLINGKLFHIDRQLPESQYVLDLQRIFLDKVRHFQMPQPILGVQNPMRVQTLHLSIQSAYLGLHHLLWLLI